MPFSESEVAEMQNVFFEASLEGYSSNSSRKYLERATGAKLIKFSRDRFVVEDRYWVGNDDYSNGITLLRRNGTPVWAMSYFGRYDKEAIPCLKAALRQNYSNRIFFGGRGPEKFESDDGLVYTNSLEFPGSFVFFSGREEIRSRGLLGWHNYYGQLLGTKELSHMEFLHD